jgi:flagellar biosynthesis anti-sigma factor FlgM
MEINGKPPLTDLSTRAMALEPQERQALRFPKPDRAPANAVSDRVELSVRSRQIQNIDDLIQSTPDVREGVVEQVRRSIADGTYNVRAEQVAERILGGDLFDQLY